MTTRDQVCAEARAWIGTPFEHQAHLKGVACDCAGMVGGVAVALELVPSDFWERDFAPHAGYSRRPSNGSLTAILDRFMERTDDPQPGDVVLMRFRKEPQHVGILVPYVHGGLALVHALHGMGVKEVVEHRLDDKWQARVIHAYRLPGI